MKTKIFILFIFAASFLQAQVEYSKYFTEKALRFDYFHSGNNNSESYGFDEMIEEEMWNGSKINLLDNLNFGTSLIKVFDAKTNTLIFSRGYCTLFGEWQTTDEAKKTFKTYTESMTIPFPKDSFRVEILTRDKKNNFVKQFEYSSSPNNYFIKKEHKQTFNNFKVHYSGNPNQKLDLVFIAEGYTKDEMDSFKKDCETFANALFKYAPFTNLKDKINIWGVESFSKESGTDIPGKNIWKNTVVNSSFYTFDSERYLMTGDYKSVCNVADNAPHEQIVIIVNTDKYGGGGIYNYYLTIAGKNKNAEKIFVHEFGHALAGLGDEYYTSDVAYEDFYPLDVEPWEANLTTLVNFESKWKNLMDPSVPVPTPNDPKYKNGLGVFEGGGYKAKGVYRPSFDSIMITLAAETFNLPSEMALKKVVEFYSK
ncbi:MAG: M64 family metallopeptidase [bacterium]